jgi:hypothetical protein
VHLGASDGREFRHDGDFPLALVFTRSKWRYDEPWYFGTSHGMAFAQIFRAADGVRFAQSPSGGGAGNPAWDFQFFIADYEVDRVYRFVMRAAYTPAAAPEDLRRALAAHLRALSPPASRLPESPVLPPQHVHAQQQVGRRVHDDARPEAARHHQKYARQHRPDD